MRFIACLGLAAVLALPAAARDLHLHTANIPPFTIANSPERPGIAVEIAQEVARRAGIGLTVTFQPWRRAQAAVIHGENLAIMPLSRTAEREGQYNWIGGALVYDVNFVSVDGREHTVASAKELGSVLVQEGTSFKTQLLDLGFSNVKAVADTAANARILAASRSDAWYVPELEALWLWKSQQLPGTPTIGPRIEGDVAWLALSPQSDPDLVAALAEALKAMIADGTRDKIISSYISDSIR